MMYLNINFNVMEKLALSRILKCMECQYGDYYREESAEGVWKCASFCLSECAPLSWLRDGVWFNPCSWSSSSACKFLSEKWFQLFRDRVLNTLLVLRDGKANLMSRLLQKLLISGTVFKVCRMFIKTFL